MSEDEAIKKLQEMIGLCTEEPKHIAYNEQRAIETLLDLYQKTKHELEGKECVIDTMTHNEEVLTRNYEILEKKLQQEKEKNKTLEELLQGRLFELYNYYKDLAGSYQANCISKDKITNILGLDSTETEEAILQYIQTLEIENARLEDIEDKKVQIEYELVFNKGVNSIKDKINAKIYQLNNTDILEDQIAITYLKELLNKEK